MILLSFDVEEFDMPFEYGKTISFDEQIAISSKGTEIILDLLAEYQIRATFFCTANFALNNSFLMKRIVDGGHELASHGYYHSKFEVSDLLDSKKALEQVAGTEIKGYRMARMMPVDEKEILKAGYSYNSSINPTWIPGRYNNLNLPRKLFYESGMLQLPASVSRWLRLPLFWLSFHNFPLWVYKRLCLRAYRTDKYLNIYFHPWEFTNLDDKDKFGLPWYVSNNSGKSMVKRMKNLIRYFNTQNLPFSTISDFLAQHNQPA